MLQNIRDGSQGWITWIIVGLISITFIAIGAGSYMSSSSTSEVLAKVNGSKITKGEVDKLYKRLMNQQPEAASDQMRTQALKSLIDNAVLLNAAKERGFTVGKQQVLRFLEGLPDFQENGKFSPEKYRNVLYHIDSTDSDFRKEIQDATLVNQLKQGFINTAFVLPEDMITVMKFEDQKRDFGFMMIPSALFEKESKPSEADITAYYKTHLNQFLTSEKVKVEYLEFRVSDAKNEDDFANKADELIRLAYEHSDSLSPAADKLELTIKQSPFLVKEANNIENPDIWNNPKVIAAVFSQEVLGRMNSDVIQIDPNYYIVFRLLENEKPKQKLLVSVKPEIEKILIAQMADKKAEALANQLLIAIKKGSDPAELAKANQVSWETVKGVMRTDKSMPTQVLEEAFALPLKNKSANKVKLSEAYRAIVVLDKVIDGQLSDLDATRRKGLEDNLAKHLGWLEFQLFEKTVLNMANIDNKFDNKLAKKPENNQSLTSHNP